MSDIHDFGLEWLGRFDAITDEIARERERQQVKFGEQNCPDAFLNQLYPIMSGDDARGICQHHFARGIGTWLDILCEEVGEAGDEAIAGDEAKLRAELVQVAAVAVAWIEAIDRRST